MAHKSLYTRLFAALCLGTGLSTPALAATELSFNPGPFQPAAALPGLHCPAPTAPLDLAIWQVTVGQGRPDHSCNNTFVGFLSTPRSASNPQDAFDQMAAQIRAARAEVLISSMDYHSFEGHPGHRLNLAMRDLYQLVKANPEKYPQGMVVRVMTGGSPPWLEEVGTRDFIRDLRQLGVPLSDAKAGWLVQSAVYRYFPHSHIKMMVTDGTQAMAAGFSIADWHQSVDQPGGHDLNDLALQMRGPVAQDALAVFDDLWRNSWQLYCPGDVAPEQVGAQCSFKEPLPLFHPIAATNTWADTSGTRGYFLYRRPGFFEADDALLALINAATTEIDMQEADLSPAIQCWYAYLAVNDCTLHNSAPYLEALLKAMQRGVKVRVVTVDYGEGKAANRSGIALIRKEAKEMGLEGQFDVRYFNGKMHTKAFTVDGKMVVVGSTNFHFSSWGSMGLAEADMATSDPAAIAQQQNRFESFWQNSRPVSLENWLKNVNTK